MARWLTGLTLAGWIAVSLAVSAQTGARRWWAPGEATPLADFATYQNDRGAVGVLNTSGRMETRGHPFFEPIGQNGRACVTCHQPADAMSVSLDSIRARWQATGGKDPLFAAIDGRNCPHLPEGDEAAHSLVLNRGLFRVFLPWPPRTSTRNATRSLPCGLESLGDTVAMKASRGTTSLPLTLMGVMSSKPSSRIGRITARWPG